MEGHHDLAELGHPAQQATADCIVDVLGYFRSEPATRLTPLSPARILDTRSGLDDDIRPELRELTHGVENQGDPPLPRSGLFGHTDNH